MTSRRIGVAEGRAPGSPLRLFCLSAAWWLAGAVTALPEETLAPLQLASGRLDAEKYLFEHVTEGFEEEVAYLLRDVSYTLVLNPAAQSAQLYVHGLGSEAGSDVPRFALERLEIMVEQGGPIDFSMAASVLDSDKPQQRARLAEVLGDVETPIATTILADLLLDDDRSVAFAAADSLVEQNSEDAVRVLGSALLTGATPLGFEVAEALTEFEMELAETYLAQAQGDADPRVRKLVEEFFSPAN